MSRRRTLTAALALGGVAAVVPPTVVGEAQAPKPTATETIADTPASATTVAVVGRQVKHPKRVRVVRTRFRPWATPTPQQVHTIIAVEAARWHVPAAWLTNRISCESGFSWSARNGQYVGLGQFASETFYRGVSSIGTRSVSMKTRRWRVKRVIVEEAMSDGSVHERRGWPVRQKVVHVYQGVIPHWPVRTHGWAQVRIAARAIAGLGRVRSSEWECSV